MPNRASRMMAILGTAISAGILTLVGVSAADANRPSPSDSGHLYRTPPMTEAPEGAGPLPPDPSYWSAGDDAASHPDALPMAGPDGQLLRNPDGSIKMVPWGSQPTEPPANASTTR